MNPSDDEELTVPAHADWCQVWTSPDPADRCDCGAGNHEEGPR